MVKPKFSLLLLICLLPLFIYSEEGKEVPWGPLLGRQESFTHVMLFSLLPRGAQVPVEGSFGLNSSFIVLQDYINTFHPDYYTKEENQIFDYEMVAFRQEFSFVPKTGVELGLSLRGHYLYEGVFDTFIEEFHFLFGFPNAGREYYPKDDIHINFKPSGLDHLLITAPQGGISSLDVWSRLAIFSDRWSKVALSGYVHLPLGDYRSGTAIPLFQGGFSFAYDFNPCQYFRFFGEAALIFPFAATQGISPSVIRPQFQAIAALEFIVLDWLSLIVQGDFLTSPFYSGSLETESDSVELTEIYSNPAMRLLIGGRFVIMDQHAIEIYIGEDVYTLTTADVDLSITYRFSYDFY